MPYRLLSAIVVCLVALPFSSGLESPQSSTQAKSKNDSDDDTRYHSNSLVLPVDPVNRRKIEAARDYLQSRQWPEVVRSLQSILDSKEDHFLQIASKGQERVWTSSRREAERLLRSMPPAGLDFYQLMVDGAARKYLGDGKEKQNLNVLAEVARRYRFTPTGSDALNQMGSYYLDRGQYDLAANCYSRLAEYPGIDQLNPLTLFKASLAMQGAGDVTKREQIWFVLQKKIGTDGFRIGNQILKTEEFRNLILEWGNKGAANSDCLVYRGNPKRLAAFPLEPHAPDFLWRKSISNNELVVSLLSGDVKKQLIEKPYLPSGTPLSQGGRLFLRTTAGIESRNQSNGELVWSNPLNLSLEKLLADPGQKVQIQHWLKSYPSSKNLLTCNTILSSLSADRRHVYAIDDLPVPPPPSMIQEMNSGVRKHYFGPLAEYVVHNRLVALDASRGTVVWSLGGRDAKTPEQVRDAFFLGPPLPLGQYLYAIVQKTQEIQLICLEAETGTIAWVQHLANAKSNPLLDLDQRTQAIHLSASEGLLICPTNSGAVVAIDYLNRSIVWASTYVTHQVQSRSEEMDEPYQETQIEKEILGPGNLLMISEDRLIMSSRDSQSYRCLRLADGKLLWEAPRQIHDLYLASIAQDAVLVVASKGIRALHFKTGKPIWEKATVEPTGQGLLINNSKQIANYLLPLGNGQLMLVDFQNPNLSKSISITSDNPLGNLLILNDQLISMTPGSIQAFGFQLKPIEQIAEQIKQQPENSDLKVALIQRLLDRDDLKKAYSLLKELPVSARIKNQQGLLDLEISILKRMMVTDFANAEPLIQDFLTQSKQRYSIEAVPGNDKQILLGLLAQNYNRNGSPIRSLDTLQRLHHQGSTGQLLAIPNRINISQRGDIWAKTLVAEMLAEATPGQIPIILDWLNREWQTVYKSKNKEGFARLIDFLALVPSKPWQPLSQARLAWVDQLVHQNQPDEIQASLHRLLKIQESGETPFLQAKAGLARIQLLMQSGMVEDANEAAKQFKNDYSNITLSDGRTAGEAIADLDQDPRFLVHGTKNETQSWLNRPIKIKENQGAFPNPLTLNSMQRLLDDQDWYNPFQVLAKTNPPISRLKFMLEWHSSRLRVMNRDGLERFSITLPFQFTEAEAQSSGHFVLDQQVVFAIGNQMVAIDLIRRQIRWRRYLIDPALNISESFTKYHNGGTTNIIPKNFGDTIQLGIVGPIDSTQIYLKTLNGILAIEPLTGQSLWLRSDIPFDDLIRGDSTTLIAIEVESNRGGGLLPLNKILAFKAENGIEISLPPIKAILGSCQRVVGRFVLQFRESEKGVEIGWYDPILGKYLWKDRFPPKTKLISSSELGLNAIILPDGNVRLVDLFALQNGKNSRYPPNLKIDSTQIPDDRGGYLLVDQKHLYLSLNHKKTGPVPILEGQSPHFIGDMQTIFIDGTLIAFDRNTGSRKWLAPMSRQFLLLKELFNSPCIVSAAMTVTQLNNTTPQTNRITTQIIEKESGKTIYHRYWENTGVEQYHSILLDPLGKFLELTAPRFKLRLAVDQKTK